MHPRSGADGAIKFLTVDTVEGGSCAEGGPEEKLKAASPRDEVLGPLDARLETCAVASACEVYSRLSESTRLKRRGVHCMMRLLSSRNSGVYGEARYAVGSRTISFTLSRCSPRRT